MTDRPILFSAPMIRASLAGTKTQTRLLLKHQPTEPSRLTGFYSVPLSCVFQCKIQGETTLLTQRIPNAGGDCLWVRENWRCNGWATDKATIFYQASEGDGYTAMCEQYPVEGKKLLRVTGGWRPSTHMPRWASRLTLIVTDVRVQRLQDISAEDAMAEGIEDVTSQVAASDPTLRFWRRYRDGGWNGYVDSAVASYASLWTEINGAGAWEANPWIVAYSFTVHRCNVDQMETPCTG